MEKLIVNLNLHNYFNDHRKVAKILIRNNMKVIEDLHKHIKSLFNINENFYLLSDNLYIPPAECIEILSNNEYIDVIPIKEVHENKTNGVAIDTKTYLVTNSQVTLVKSQVKNVKKKENVYEGVSKENNEQKEIENLKPTNVLLSNGNDHKRHNNHIENPIKEIEIHSNINIKPNDVETNKNKIHIKSIDILPKEKHYDLSKLLNNNINNLNSTTETDNDLCENKINDSLQLQEMSYSDNVSGSDYFEINSLKRKRKRTRTRKNKKTNFTNETNQKNVEEIPAAFIPPKTIAAPKFHIKFTDNQVDTKIDDTKDDLDISTKENLKENQNDETTKQLDFNKELPPVNSVILFKRIKLGPNCNPTVSENIKAKVLNISGDDILIQILVGENEFEEFTEEYGNFENGEKPEVYELVIGKQHFIDPILLKP